jgi:hypothetical protein
MKIRTRLFVLFAAALLITTGCKTTTTTPSTSLTNAFTISDFQFSVKYWIVSGSLAGTYANGSSAEAAVSGTIAWGDGATTAVSGIKLPSGKSSNWSISLEHTYAAAGVYELTFDLTANFSDGPISASLIKTVVVNQ